MRCGKTKLPTQWPGGNVTDLTLRGIEKRFGSFVALEGLDLDVRSGELVSLLGPSGCGKTTTLRLIAGLEVPDGGEILFDGRDVSGLAIQQRNVGMVFQRYALFPHMSVERNVSFGLRVRGLPKPEIARRVDEMLDVVQLTAFRHRFPSQLSGGQMQRVAIARTLVTNPAVLMMDEPLANLDTKLRGEMRVFIRGLQRRLGITLVFVTHDQVEALELSDRVAVMFDGRVAQYDVPDAIYHRPRSAAVARFFGMPNLFEGVVRRDGAAAAVETPFAVLPVADAAGHADGARVTVMLRSECALLSRPPEPPTLQGGAMAGTIETVDFFGAIVSYGVRTGTALLRVDEMSRRHMAVGDAVQITIPTEHIWVVPETSATATTNKR
jgi:putative spermidine/putrescine transport system ATP-binding protein